MYKVIHFVQYVWNLELMLMRALNMPKTLNTESNDFHAYIVQRNIEKSYNIKTKPNHTKTKITKQILTAKHDRMKEEKIKVIFKMCENNKLYRYTAGNRK